MLKKKNSGELKAEMRAFNETRRKTQDRLIEKWNRVDVGAGLDNLYKINPHRARCTAMAIQNQENHLKQLNETVISTSFAMKPENLLKVVRIGTANSNRGDIFTEYPLQTTDDALFYIYMTYEQALRGAAAGDYMYEKALPYVAGEQFYIDTTGTGATQYTIVCGNIPIVANKVIVLLDGALIGMDDGSGNIARVGASTVLTTTQTTWNCVTTSSGVVKLEFTAAVPVTSTIRVLYDWNSEDSTLAGQYGTIGISLVKKRFNARPHPLGYAYSTMTELTLGTTGIGNAEELLVGAVGDEHAKAKDYKAIARARTVALMNSTVDFDTAFAVAGEVSAKSHAQMITKTIGNISAAIYDDIKRGMINKAVAGSKALEYVRLHDGWTEDTRQPRTGVYKAGKLNDIEFFGCPADASLVNNNEILLTYKNPEEGLDLSLVFGTLTEIAASLKYPTFYTVGNVAAVEDTLTINTKFVRLLTLSNL